MLIMPAFIIAPKTASRARDGIGCVHRAFTLGQIPEEKNGRVTLLASDNDIPSSELGVDGHGKLFHVEACEEYCAGTMTQVVGAVL